MEVLETINKVFAFNVRRLRGNASQSEIADLAEMPLRTYQRYEAGVLPRKKRHLMALCRALKTAETALFRDPDLLMSPEEALHVLRRALGLGVD